MTSRPSPTDPRKTRAWRRLTKRVAAEEPLCWLRLPGCTYWSTTGDHVIPVDDRPDLALERSNVRGACEHCNKARGKRPATTTPTERPALDIFD